MAYLAILHISDLHRDPSHEVTNGALLDSLLRDRDRYRHETPAIPDPNIIIVSGDIIHGVKADARNPEGELRRQYEQAEEFLIGLAENVVGGDREKVILIPGNHDVSFFHTLQSMRQVEVKLDTKEDRAAAVSMGRRLDGVGSVVRWSWSGFCFYEITDQAKYDARLQAFCTFYQRFYGEKRSYSLKAEEKFDVFDFPEYNVTIAGLSSCHENDPLNKKGAIHPDCLAAAMRKLCEPAYRGRLLLATWHHNTSGGPTQADYMDVDILQVMIDDGFSIGLHGHQHKPQFIEDRRVFGGARKITVISAGTLCAGRQELPAGQMRA
ncbi:MAG TPA: metallophosphoesterase [Pirellulales bacterium]|nr:metallophosphoesterase [Pirellulales bacterium]HVB34215.1 metallophosphoesterase [Patescibacteria group bacterium]